MQFVSECTSFPLLAPTSSRYLLSNQLLSPEEGHTGENPSEGILPTSDPLVTEIASVVHLLWTKRESQQDHQAGAALVEAGAFQVKE